MSAFLEMARNLRDRNFGGTSGTQVADPYISGYHFTTWRLPSYLNDYMTKGFMGATEGNPNIIDNYSDAQSVLAATCLSVTPPGGTLNKAEFIGLGGTKWSVPTNIDYGNSLTCKFVEMTGLPILQIIGGWVKMIRDNKIGLSHLHGFSELSKENYAATVFYWTTKPDGFTVEYSACYSGVFPTKDPQDLFTGDVASVDKLEMDIDFNVDFIWHEDWVHEKCQYFANNAKNAGTHAGYGSEAGRQDKLPYSEQHGNAMNDLGDAVGL